MYDTLERAATSVEDTPPTERMSLGDSVVVGPMGNSQGNSTAGISEPRAVTPAQAAHRISIMYKYVMQSLIPIDMVPVNVCVLCPPHPGSITISVVFSCCSLDGEMMSILT